MKFVLCNVWMEAQTGCNSVESLLCMLAKAYNVLHSAYGVLLSGSRVHEVINPSASCWPVSDLGFSFSLRTGGGALTSAGP